ncbi:hypothetical protein QBC31_42900 [Streptomyces sp. B21-079]
MGRFDELIGPLRAKFEAVVPHLNERQRRLLYGAEARQLGLGGIAAVASAAGVSKGCVSRGLADLEQGAEPVGPVRRTGGGRPAAADKDPGLRTALLDLVDDSTQGDPIGPLTWTTKSLRKLARELAARGHDVGRDTVAALLKEAGFSLRGNARVLAGQRIGARRRPDQVLVDLPVRTTETHRNFAHYTRHSSPPGRESGK